MDNKSIRPLLDYVVSDDLEGSKDRFGLASLVVTLNRHHPDNPQLVTDWANTAIDAIYERQHSFQGVVAEEYAEKARFYSITLGSRPLKAVAIESDLDQVQAYSRSKAGGQAAITVQLRSNGQVSIMTNKYYRLRLPELTRILRVEELAVRGEKSSLRWYEMEVEGTLQEVPQWHYFKPGEMLLNGSPTHPDVPPTAISLDRIMELVQLAHSKAFDPIRETACKNNVCTSTRDDTCPLYDFGLYRCRDVRKAAYQANLAIQAST